VGGAPHVTYCYQAIHSKSRYQVWAQTVHHPSHPFPLARMHIPTLLPSPLTHITTSQPPPLPFPSRSLARIPLQHVHTTQPPLISQGACTLPHIALYPLPSEWRWVSSCMQVSACLASISYLHSPSEPSSQILSVKSSLKCLYE
jgi:hypothetical protein